MHETTKHNIEKINEKYKIIGSKGKHEIKLQLGRFSLVTPEKGYISIIKKV